MNFQVIGQIGGSSKQQRKLGAAVAQQSLLKMTRKKGKEGNKSQKQRQT